MTPSLRRRTLSAAVSGATIAGAALLAPASPAHAVLPSPAKPYDFNGDGHPELVIGAPGTHIGSAPGQGAFIVIPGTSVGHGNAGATRWDVNSLGMPGRTSSTYLQLGFSFASTDLDVDGYADLVVGAPGASFNGVKYAGGIYVLHGSKTGLSHKHIQFIPGTSVAGPGPKAFFGISIVAGDFNGDGVGDIAAGKEGGVYVMDGAAPGTTPTGAFLSPAPQVTGESPAFGATLAAGDFNGDGMTDLAVGDPIEWHDRGYSTGAVTIFMNRKNSPLRTVKRFSLQSAGVPGSSTIFGKDAPDLFSGSLAAGDLDGDGYADLVVGVPGLNASSKVIDSGAVLRLYGTANGLTAHRASLATASLPLGRRKSGETFGSTVAVANLLGHAHPQVWVAAQAANYVVELRSKASDPTLITQDVAGIPDHTEAGDNFGACLLPFDENGDGVDSLYIGSFGEDRGAGSVILVSADVDHASRPLSGLLYKLGVNHLPGSHAAGTLAGSCS